MWPDNETERDFLNFSGVAETVAKIIVQADGQPVSIGVSGAWGTGKSSMIKLIHASLRDELDQKGRLANTVFVEFDAWLYQGYDDARAALMDVIADRLHEIAEKNKKGIDKAKDFLKRVRWLRVAKLAGTAAVGITSVALGFPALGLVGEAIKLGKQIADGKLDEESLKTIKQEAADLEKDAIGLLGAKPDASPPKEIHALRQSFEETLKELDLTLVVLIDDLDRCLPETTISTLEAIRLFLFLRGTAFVIAADTAMIKYAVRRHFHGVEDEALVTSYFDKLIQVPIQVPPLGTQEVRAYMMMLFVDNSELSPEVKESIREAICHQLRRVWQGARVDRAFLQSLGQALPDGLVAKLDASDRLAPLMATATGIAGNPRLIKRFLNALSIRMAISDAQGVGVDEAVLAKLLLFERLAPPAAYEELTAAVTGGEDGRPALLREWEEHALAGEEFQLPSTWDTPFVREWLTLSPILADRDVRGALYVGREHSPMISLSDRLGSEAAELLTALLQNPAMAAQLADRLRAISRIEQSMIMDRLLDVAGAGQEWGVPPILDACLTLAGFDDGQAQRVADFLRARPLAQIRPNIVPKVGNQPWAEALFQYWQNSEVSRQVKNAIQARRR
jgi:predicted KAP-like P-loop ATPase